MDGELPSLEQFSAQHSCAEADSAVWAFMSAAFAQDDAEAAKSQWRKVADQLRPKLPKLAGLLDEAEGDVLAYMVFPAAHRTKRKRCEWFLNAVPDGALI